VEVFKVPSLGTEGGSGIAPKKSELPAFRPQNDELKVQDSLM
jgi:hypothetical protein